MPRLEFIALASSAALACSATPAAVRPHVPQRQLAIGIRSRTMIVPPISAPRLLAHEPGAASYFAVGGVRVRLRAGDAVLGDQPFASTLVGAVRLSAGGWLFASAAGVIARAEDFVGPLTFQEALGHPVMRAFPWEGGLAVVFADGTVRKVGPGAGPLPHSVLEHPSAAPLSTPENETGAVSEAAVNRFPMSRVALASTALLGTGELALRGSGTLYFATMLNSGALSAIGRVPLTGETASDCGVRGWGARALLTCPDVPGGNGRSNEVTPYVADADGIARAGLPSRSPLLAGREGHTLTLRGPCPEPAVPGGTPAAAVNVAVTLGCTLDRERDWREWQYPRSATLVDVYDQFALFSEAREATTVLKLYEIDAARVRNMPLSDTTVAIERAGFTPDGRVLVLGSAGGDRERSSQVGVGAVGDLIVLRPVGFYAQDAVMVDSQRGFAIGLNAANLAQTVDGGLTWTHVDVAVDGDPAQISLAPDEETVSDHVLRNGDRLDCSSLACRVVGRLVHRWATSIEVVPAMAP